MVRSALPLGLPRRFMVDYFSSKSNHAQKEARSDARLYFIKFHVCLQLEALITYFIPLLP